MVLHKALGMLVYNIKYFYLFYIIHCFAFVVKWREKIENIKWLVTPNYDFYLGYGTFNACHTQKIPLLVPPAEIKHIMYLNLISYKSKLVQKKLRFMTN